MCVSETGLAQDVVKRVMAANFFFLTTVASFCPCINHLWFLVLLFFLLSLFLLFHFILLLSSSLFLSLLLPSILHSSRFPYTQPPPRRGLPSLSSIYSFLRPSFSLTDTRSSNSSKRNPAVITLNSSHPSSHPALQPSTHPLYLPFTKKRKNATYCAS